MRLSRWLVEWRAYSCVFVRRLLGGLYHVAAGLDWAVELGFGNLVGGLWFGKSWTVVVE